MNLVSVNNNTLLAEWNNLVQRTLGFDERPIDYEHHYYAALALLLSMIYMKVLLFNVYAEIPFIPE